MFVLPPDERAAIIDVAMRRKFGKLLTWARPTLLHTFGPNDIGFVDRFEIKLLNAKKLVLETLADWSDDAIHSLGVQLKNKSRIEESAWEAIGGSAIDELFRREPPPIAYGFGHPSFRTDFDYWGKMPQLAIHEALMLSVGADPASLSPDDLLALSNSQKKGVTLWSAHDFLVKRYEQFKRHFTHTGWGYSPESLPGLKGWFDVIGLAVQPEFYAELSKRTFKKPDEPLRATQGILTGQERETLLKLIAAMACEQYGYDPSKERSEATSRIMEDIELVGLTMDAKTIRKWLKEASELVDPAYWSKLG